MNRSCNAHPEPFSAHAGEDVSRIAPRASIKFLADAFAVWCDQKSRLAGARATGLLDDESHAALAEAYARTRELIGALLARAEVRRAAAADSDNAAHRTTRVDAAHHAVSSAAGVADTGGRAAGEPPRAGNCPAC